MPGLHPQTFWLNWCWVLLDFGRVEISPGEWNVQQVEESLWWGELSHLILTIMLHSLEMGISEESSVRERDIPIWLMGKLITVTPWVWDWHILTPNPLFMLARMLSQGKLQKQGQRQQPTPLELFASCFPTWCDPWPPVPVRGALSLFLQLWKLERQGFTRNYL